MGPFTEAVDATRNSYFGQEKWLQVEPRLFSTGFSYQISFRPRILDGGHNDFPIDLCQFRGTVDDGGFGKADVPFLAQLLQHVTQGGAGA